ncbi:Uncharacterised protein [Moraxella lacunata]|uniref:Uncharacterized protein n=1 Tax=Moraxella lacunata TaxID=477 RepID=A0A378TPY4_MORLA|nr:Uncharacterised protein [Moraxella lacunata]
MIKQHKKPPKCRAFKWFYFMNPIKINQVNLTYYLALLSTLHDTMHHEQQVWPVPTPDVIRL